MEGPTHFVEIPGYADALRREDRLRRSAWVQAGDTLAGVPVRALTWRDIEELTEMRNGLFCPWRFESEAEFIGHCAQLVWWLSDCAKPGRGDSWLGRLIVRGQRERLIRHLRQYPRQLADDVKRYLADTFLDAPAGGSGTTAGGAIAGGPAYLADALASGGHALSLDAMLDLPVVRLFQLLRLVRRRLYGETITNASDKLATDYLATLQPAGGAN